MAKHKTKKCPNCKRIRPVFVIEKEKCDICRVETKRQEQAESPKVKSWKDIKAKCRKALRDTDWALASDVVEDGEITKKTQNRYRLYRKKIRAIKNGPETPAKNINWPKPPK